MTDRAARSSQLKRTAPSGRLLIGRRFVAASLLVHLFVLAFLPGLPGPSNPIPASAPLTVRLSTLPPPADQSPAVRDLAAATMHTDARARQQPSEAMPQARSSIALAVDAGRSSAVPSVPQQFGDAPAAPPVSPLATETAAPASAPATALASALVATPAVKPANDSAPHAPRERRGKPSTLWLAEYTEALSGQVGRVKQYPAVARLRGWQGTAIVSIRLAADGAIVDTRITQSTGHDILDRQALAMVRRAEPLPPFPEPDSGEPLLVQLPIVFALAPRE